MAQKLDGRVAIVTGGVRGIGLAYCKALADVGATVVAADIAVVNDVELDGAKRPGRGSVHAKQFDVSDERSVESLINDVVSRFGKIDILVNNAAIFSSLPPVPMVDIDVSLWDQVMAVNVRGAFLMAKHVVPHMARHNYGKIINIGSGTAYKGASLMLHYVTSKGAIVSFTRALAREVGQSNICVNTLSPGLIMSDSISANEAHIDAFRAPVLQSRAIKRDGYPEDLFGALLFLASSDSDFVTGQSLIVDGGSAML